VSGIRDILGLEELDKETLSKGAAGGALPQSNRWNPSGSVPVQQFPGNLWPDEIRRGRDRWDTWPRGTPAAIVAKWPTPADALWSKAGSALQSAKKFKQWKGAI